MKSLIQEAKASKSSNAVPGNGAKKLDVKSGANKFMP